MTKEDSEDSEGSRREQQDDFDVDWLSTSEFILMNLSRHYSIENYSLYKFADPAVAHSFFHVLVVYVAVGIPIGYMEIVLGQYTNMGMFHIKHMVPISQGMSFTFCLQVFATTTLCVLLMTQYAVYGFLSLVNRESVLPWLECPKNYTNTCFSPTVSKCSVDEGPCITETRHLSGYIYWNEVYMKGVVPREQADIAIPPAHRIQALLAIWLFVYLTMAITFRKIKKFIMYGFAGMLVYKFMQLATFLFARQYIVYVPRMFNINIASFINYRAWKSAIQKVTVGMGLGDFSYIMFGILSKTGRNTGTLIWFCGMTSFFLTMIDHIIISGGTYDLCEQARLPIEKRYLLFRPGKMQLEFGIMPTILGSLMTPSLWTALYFVWRLNILLYHIMLNYSFLQLSLYQKYPVLQAYGIYIKPLFCFFGFITAVLLDSKEAYMIRYDILQIVFEFCDLCNILIITIIVFYIYGVAKFCDDVHFMTGGVPTVYWRATWIFSPLVLMVALPLQLFKSSDVSYNLRLITVGIFYSPYIVFLSIAIVQKIYQKKLLTLLRATEEWGPRGFQQRIYRKSFNPRMESKRKNLSYKCAHTCLIETDVPLSEEDDMY